jgi:hypothetical protein
MVSTPVSSLNPSASPFSPAATGSSHPSGELPSWLKFSPPSSSSSESERLPALLREGKSPTGPWAYTDAALSSWRASAMLPSPAVVINSTRMYERSARSTVSRRPTSMGDTMSPARRRGVLGRSWC